MTKTTKNGAFERRNVVLGEVKFVEPDENNSEMLFSGYGAVFGNVDSYDDVIAKGAFAQTIKDASSSGIWPAMLLQHGGMFQEDDLTPIGVWTLMKEDDVGLYVEGKFANTEKGRETYELLKMTPRPALNGLSIGFRAREWSARSTPEEPRRTLTAVDLIEISLVTFPANIKARVINVKSEFNPRAIEDSLRDAGLSRADSVKAVAVFKSILHRDDEEPESAPRDEVVAAEKRSAELVSLADRIRKLASPAK